ncbi:enoyl-CoA hydratase [Enterovirga aerilata]|uniref:Enoyl-CoA hydratase n=1 Tax=Enterovirga aerilata TaxID=2730920 RepID=A0A849IBX4_9HYPH|nr:enoyl-CoA hydratase [Enterovirga sp. DB1703]NNM73477.1 enoyl-CoA hydratase [Enterovirga sp. DB1703]
MGADFSIGTIGLAVEGALATITLDQPARHNAMSLAMWRELPERVEAAVADERVRAILVTGAGERAFCAGADISEFGENRSGPDAAAAYDRAVHAAIDALRTAAKPTIAAIRGICFGGGLEIALCCDLRIASAGARFRLPAARLGLGYAYEGVALLADRLGAGAAAEILFTAAILDAEEARRAGIVGRVFAEESFASDAAAYAASVTRNAPLVLKALKLGLLEHAKPAGERDFALLQAAVSACSASEDYREGQAAFRERREPRFTGR